MIETRNLADRESARSTSKEKRAASAYLAGSLIDGFADLYLQRHSPINCLVFHKGRPMSWLTTGLLIIQSDLLKGESTLMTTATCVKECCGHINGRSSKREVAVLEKVPDFGVLL
jgi:hypothetical protein